MVRFLVVCFVYKTNPDPRKLFAHRGKVDQMPLENLICLGVGLALGWGVRRFHNNIYYVFQPNIIWYIVNTIVFGDACARPCFWRNLGLDNRPRRVCHLACYMYGTWI